MNIWKLADAPFAFKIRTDSEIVDLTNAKDIRVHLISPDGQLFTLSPKFDHNEMYFDPIMFYKGIWKFQVEMSLSNGICRSTIEEVKVI